MSKYANLKFEKELPADEEYEVMLTNAMETVLKFGKYKQKTLHELVLSVQGRSYLKWMASDESSFKDHMKDKVKVVLVFAENQLKQYL